MGEVSMVTPEVSRGERTVQLLDQANVQAYGAFWYLEESERWTFYLYTPLTDKFGKRYAYEVVRQALPDRPSVVPLREIKLLPAHSPLLEILGRVFATPYTPGQVHNIDIVNSTIDGHLVRQAWVYRLALGPAFFLRTESMTGHLTGRLTTPDYGGLAPASAPGRGAATMPPNRHERARIEKTLAEVASLQEAVASQRGKNPTIDQLRRLWELEYEWGLMDPAVYRP